MIDFYSLPPLPDDSELPKTPPRPQKQPLPPPKTAATPEQVPPNPWLPTINLATWTPDSQTQAAIDRLFRDADK